MWNGYIDWIIIRGFIRSIHYGFSTPHLRWRYCCPLFSHYHVNEEAGYMTSFRPHMLGSVVISLLLLLLFIIISPTFPHFDYVVPEKQLLPITEDGNAALSRVLWINRQLDIMVLALLLFITGIGCATLLHSTQGETS
jgi:hypothetical protein